MACQLRARREVELKCLDGDRHVCDGLAVRGLFGPDRRENVQAGIQEGRMHPVSIGLDRQTVWKPGQAEGLALPAPQPADSPKPCAERNPTRLEPLIQRFGGQFFREPAGRSAAKPSSSTGALAAS